ncbi:transcriptional regulatory [Fusarium mundagurra]|uniref:Transcriptional regulatory n=1 Tax=Fusarium mundagurra TaxID=1567541 RepID=A0A8H5Y0L4_9HYPO|nr:transcriptional regulatory [Fusarium mundagurra]
MPSSEDVIDAFVAHLHDPNLVPTLERIEEAFEEEQTRIRLESAAAQVKHSTAIATRFAAGSGDLVLRPNCEDLERALQSLDNEKSNYLDNVRNEVESYIKNQSIKTCLGIIETLTVDGRNVPERYPFSSTSAWSKRFAAFTAGRDPAQPPQYKGNPLDSFLTEPVKDRIVDCTLQFYSEQQGHLVECLVDLLVAMPTFRNGIREQIQIHLSEVQPPIPPQQQAVLATTVTDDILGPIAASVFTINGNNAKDHVAVAKGAIRATLAKSIAEVVRDYLSRPEFREQIETLVSGAVYNTIIISMITAFVSLGVIATFSVSAWWLIAPPIVGFALATYKAVNIPGDLGRKVSEAIGKRLDESFRPYNEQILSNIFEDTIRNQLVRVGSDLLENNTVSENIKIRLQQQSFIEG